MSTETTAPEITESTVELVYEIAGNVLKWTPPSETNDSALIDNRFRVIRAVLEAFVSLYSPIPAPGSKWIRKSSGEVHTTAVSVMNKHCKNVLKIDDDEKLSRFYEEYMSWDAEVDRKYRLHQKIREVNPDLGEAEIEKIVELIKKAA